MDTLDSQLIRFTPALQLASVLPRSAMKHLRYLFFSLMMISLGWAVISNFVTLGQYEHQALGLALIFLGLWGIQICLYLYHNSFYFSGLDSIIAQEDKTQTGITYELAELVNHNKNDLTMAFFKATTGRHILARLDIPPEGCLKFVANSRVTLTSSDMPLSPQRTTTLLEYAEYLYMYDVALQSWLTDHAISRELFLGAVSFVIHAYHQYKRRQRWWSRDQLSHTTGIADELAYGTAFEAERFSRSLYSSAVYANLGATAAHTDSFVERIEQTLARNKAANVLLIGNAGVGKMDILIRVAEKLATGKGLNSLSGQRLILLDTDRLFTLCPNKEKLEEELLILLNQATHAGNISIVVENLSHVIAEADDIGVALPEFLDIYLALPSLHIIGTDTPAQYHRNLETLGAFTRRFEEILVEAPSLEHTTTLLERIALTEEATRDVFFTYASLNTITVVADRYVTEGTMPDKAITLLIEIVSQATQEQTKIITPDYVFTYIRTKTGIPIGPVDDTERDKLLHLEDKIHERIVDQDAAVSAIANTMRRARADIERIDKPIGSFLFLGPTGVGKTETAKALAAVLFDNADTMVRFDMSEYSDEDALIRLIGKREQTGTLSNHLREHPYSLVLLDEFEKANSLVHDLFLQILDEGYFTDGRDEQINLRNTIIIATSNAGSELIVRTSTIRSKQTILNQNIINFIIKKRILKPELINRFDNVTVFEPLTKNAQQNITRLMLDKLTARIATRGYTLNINMDIVPLLVERGFDARFGARPLGRIIQNLVEEKIAKLIIAGSIQKGGTLTLRRADFTEEELTAVV